MHRWLLWMPWKNPSFVKTERCRFQESSFFPQNCELHQRTPRLQHFRERAPALGNHYHSRALARRMHLLKGAPIHECLKWKLLRLQMESLPTLQPQCKETRPQEKELHNWLLWGPGLVHHRQRCPRRKSHARVRWAQSKLWQDWTWENANAETGNHFRDCWLQIC